MAKVSFILRAKTGNKAQLIYLSYYFMDYQFRYSIGLKCEPKYWDFKRQRIKNNAYTLDTSAINEHITKIENFVNSLENKATINRIFFNAEYLKASLDNFLKPSTQKTGINFIEFITQLIADLKSHKMLIAGKKLSPGTIKFYNSVLNNIIKYEKHIGKVITFDNISQQTYDGLTKYLTLSCGYSYNYVGSIQKTLKTFLNHARKMKHITGEQWWVENKIYKENAVDTYLNTNEIQALLSLDLSQNERLQKIRDQFMVGLYTGLRFKDWPKVLTAPLKQTASGNEYYEIATQKTGTVVMIPATEQLKKLLSQKPSFKISDQKFNSYVKELCRLAGLNKAITIVHTVGGERKTKIEPQWSQISSHTARRSFATNMYLAGFEKSLIMGITGHKTEAAFMKYLKQDASSNIDLIMAQMAKNL